MIIIARPNLKFLTNAPVSPIILRFRMQNIFSIQNFSQARRIREMPGLGFL